MTVHLVNPSHLSFGVGVITPRWLFVLARGDTGRVRTATHRRRDARAARSRHRPRRRHRRDWDPHGQRAARLRDRHGRASARARRWSSAASTRRCIQTRRTNSEARTRSSAATATWSGRWCSITPCTGTLQPTIRGRTRRRRPVRAGALGSAAGGPIHVGFRADRARLPETLFVLLGVAHRRPEAAAARRRQRRGRDHRAAPARLPLRGARRRQLLSGHADGPGDGGAAGQRARASNSCGRCAPSDSS